MQGHFIRVLLRTFVNVCRWWWDRRFFFWSTITVALAIGVFNSWLFLPFKHDSSPFDWAVKNSVIVLLSSIILGLLAIITGLARFVPLQLPDKMLEKKYFDKLIKENETVAPEGIPTEYAAEPVPIDEVFIPLSFRVNLPLADYPITPKESLKYTKDDITAEEATQEIKGILSETDKNWQRKYNDDEKVDILELWRRLTKTQPAAVILGQLGAGKSTLMARLALCMARRYLNKPEKEPFNQLPLLFPILISLQDYAMRLKEYENSHPTSAGAATEFTFLMYLKHFIQQMHLFDLEEDQAVNEAALLALFKKRLKTDHCLVIFDGLDEAGVGVHDWARRNESGEVMLRGQVKNAIEELRLQEVMLRNQVKNAIEQFITASPGNDKTSDFNRFLITSRVAGYEQTRLGYSGNYIIAELTHEQIQTFLPNWLRASIRKGYAFHDPPVSEDEIAKEANKDFDIINATILLYPGVSDLAETPLLVTLIAMMQRRSTLRRRRVELYQDVTSTLLERRSFNIGLPPIDEAKAVQCLGPLANTMQESDKPFVYVDEVMKSLTESTLKGAGSDAANSSTEMMNEAQEEARSFLERMRMRVGIFVRRSNSYYGFYHQKFQEYFAARYMHSEIKGDYDKEIRRLVEQFRKNRKQLYETFLLVVAYDSIKGGNFAGKIMRTLLDLPSAVSNQNQQVQIADVQSQQQNFSQTISAKDKELDILTAAQCLIEVNIYNIDSTLKRTVADLVLQLYQSALKDNQMDTCRQIEMVVQRWLQSLQDETSLSSFPHFLVLKEALDKVGNRYYETVLNLLAKIAAHLVHCQPVVFDKLIPPILALAGLPSFGVYAPASHLTIAADDLLSLALIACVGFITSNKEMYHAVGQSIESMHTGSVQEIKFVLRLLEETSDKVLFDAALCALGKASPATLAAWSTLEEGKSSQKEDVRIVVERLLNLRAPQVAP